MFGYKLIKEKELLQILRRDLDLRIDILILKDDIKSMSKYVPKRDPKTGKFISKK